MKTFGRVVLAASLTLLGVLLIGAGYLLVPIGFDTSWELRDQPHPYTVQTDTAADSPHAFRTPGSRFVSLADFPYAPRYLYLDDEDFGRLRVHYVDEGPEDGPVIVCLHGQATWAYSFRHMIPIFVEAGYRVIAPDFIGFGRSDKLIDWKSYSYEKYVRWLSMTLDQLDVRASTGFLFDWGGYFGLPVAVERPDFFDRLILVTTTLPRGEGLPNALWVAWWRNHTLRAAVFPIGQMVSDMTDTDLSPATISGLDAPFPNETFKTGPRSLPLLIPATPLNPATAPNQVVWEQLRSWNKPTMTLIGERLTRGFDPRVFHEQIPGTRGQPHEVYQRVGFFIIEDAPEEMANKTLEFIRRTSQVPSTQTLGMAD